MKGEIPVFKKCCICVPLRRGLLAWGYLKVIVDVLYLWVISSSLIDTFMTITAYEKEERISSVYSNLVISTIGDTIFFTDLIVTIIFIVGGHKKNVQLIRIFYFLSIGMWVLTFLLTDAVIVVSVHQTIAHKYSNLDIIVMVIACYFFILAAQSYFLILLRCEINKLRKIDEFKFENKAAEVKCTIKCEDIITKEESVKAHI